MENIKEINIADVAKIYSGKPGCMCGCKGRYVEGEKALRLLNNMKKFLDLSPEIDEGFDLDGKKYVAAENEQRLYVVYYK
jgi:hypothetical protein